MRKIMRKAIHALLISVELLAPVLGRAQQAPPRNLVYPSASKQIEKKVEPSVNFAFGTIDFPGAPDSDAQGINDKNEIVGAYGGGLPDFVRVCLLMDLSRRGPRSRKLPTPERPSRLPSA